MQELLQLLADMGIGSYGESGDQYTGEQLSSIMDIGNISPESIAQSMQKYFNVDYGGGETIPAHLFQSIPKSSLQAALGKSYSPMMQASGESLLGKLSQDVGGAKGAQAFGGFAGSGQQGRYVQGAKDVYGKGMSDTLMQVGQQRSQALGSLQDVVNQWRQTAAELT